jgi:dCTP deaminase
MVSAQKLQALIQDGTIGVDPLLEDSLHGAAARLHMGEWYQVQQGKEIDLDSLSSLPAPVKIDAEELHLLPNQLVLAKSLERVHLADGYMGWLETRGRAANVGLQVHLADSHLDPGTDARPWLQLKNQSDHPLVLRRGTYIAKMYVFELSH